MSIHKELFEIQQKLVVPKAQRNDFGKYNYRSCEDIIEAVKKVSTVAIIINDDLQLIGERYYVKATVTLINDKGESVSTSAFARESLTKKGMDESQITGACSSYARKYAMNAMFAIDDTKDADTLDNRHELAKTEKEILQEKTQYEMSALIDAKDELGFKQIWHELNRPEQEKYWTLLSVKQRNIAKELLAQPKKVKA